MSDCLEWPIAALKPLLDKNKSICSLKDLEEINLFAGRGALIMLIFFDLKTPEASFPLDSEKEKDH